MSSRRKIMSVLAGRKPPRETSRKTTKPVVHPLLRAMRQRLAELTAPYGDEVDVFKTRMKVLRVLSPLVSAVWNQTPRCYRVELVPVSPADGWYRIDILPTPGAMAGDPNRAPFDAVKFRQDEVTSGSKGGTTAMRRWTLRVSDFIITIT